MATPTEKSDSINNLINSITGDDRVKQISGNRCVRPPIGCGGPAVEFKDEISKKEYTISGLCQKCQDSIFG